MAAQGRPGDVAVRISTRLVQYSRLQLYIHTLILASSHSQGLIPDLVHEAKRSLEYS
jgi:hypothetical protein